MNKNKTAATGLGVVGKYGQAAIQAVLLINSPSGCDPVFAWDKAVSDIFPNSPSSRKKGCPRGAFLGLCEEGYLQGVRKRNYTKSKKNKQYAVAAVEQLHKDPSISKDELWARATGRLTIRPNGQMDVVISLWNQGFISVS